MNKRRFEVNVRNALGDEAVVIVEVPGDRNPRQHSAMAVRKAMLVLPDERPWKVGSWNEVPACSAP